MCVKSHTVFLCAHSGHSLTQHCTAIFDPSRDFCAIPSRAITRDFCCSQKCCKEAVTSANDRWFIALAEYDHYFPSMWDTISNHTAVLAKRTQLEKKVGAARITRDAVQAKHSACTEMRREARDESRKMRLKRRDGTEGVEAMSPADVHEKKVLEAETRVAEKGGSMGCAVFPIGGQCSNRPKGKGRVFD